jgi:hypothetical protein
VFVLHGFPKVVQRNDPSRVLRGQKVRSFTELTACCRAAKAVSQYLCPVQQVKMEVIRLYTAKFKWLSCCKMRLIEAETGKRANAYRLVGAGPPSNARVGGFVNRKVHTILLVDLRIVSG